jgi:aerobic-type carbon monoxide dehydrogenase small subunit (CoxS/CutS family)
LSSVALVKARTRHTLLEMLRREPKLFGVRAGCGVGMCGDHTAFQCSYCTPGFILKTRALLEEKPNATADEARDYLSGNLCRCGSYLKIMDAVLDAGDRLQSSDRP